MKCPVCKEPDPVMSDRQGIEIDYCLTCRGIWLDRGELDKIIEKSTQPANVRPVSGDALRPVVDPYYEGHGYHDDHHKYGCIESKQYPEKSCRQWQGYPRRRYPKGTSPPDACSSKKSRREKH